MIGFGMYILRGRGSGGGVRLLDRWRVIVGTGFGVAFRFGALSASSEGIVLVCIETSLVWESVDLIVDFVDFDVVLSSESLLVFTGVRLRFLCMTGFEKNNASSSSICQGVLVTRQLCISSILC